jgi:LacI family transcriptional regulator
MALRDHPGLPRATRRRVKRLAGQLGYRPDPTLVKVMTAMARRKLATVTGPLILLCDLPKEHHYREPKNHLNRYYDGVVRRAAELGYRVEEFWLRAPHMTTARAEQILANRGIEGLIILNYESAPATLTLNLSPFASAVIGRALVKPRIFAVDSDHHQGLFECIMQLRRRGCKRPGLLLSADAHERTMHCSAAAYQFHLSQQPEYDRIPILLDVARNHDAFRAWVRTYRPDAIITHDETMLDFVTASGFSVPDDFSLAVLFWRDDGCGCAGIDTRDEAQGARAVEYVVERIRNNQFGLPSDPEMVLFDGIWRDGPSVANRKLADLSAVC